MGNRYSWRYFEWYFFACAHTNVHANLIRIVWSENCQIFPHEAHENNSRAEMYRCITHKPVWKNVATFMQITTSIERLCRVKTPLNSRCGGDLQILQPRNHQTLSSKPTDDSRNKFDAHNKLVRESYLRHISTCPFREALDIRLTSVNYSDSRIFPKFHRDECKSRDT